jgi:hypothetical protein
VQVRYDEGVANHIGPEPCAVAREGVGEASVGEHTGQPNSRRVMARFSVKDGVLRLRRVCVLHRGREQGRKNFGGWLFREDTVSRYEHSS